MDFEESVAWLSGLRRFGIKLGLERFLKVLELAGNPHRAFRSAHIAGTNGKGSTAAMIAAVMRKAGVRTGLYLSPYVFDIRERIQVEGRMVTRRRFAQLATEARSLMEEAGSRGWGTLTEFEAKTLMGFLCFAQDGVEFASVEVGLGGRLDATNVIVPDVSVITNVAMDHMEYLGETLAQIAAEKAGIIKQGVPVVCGSTDSTVSDVVMRRAEESGSPVIWALPEGQQPPEGVAGCVTYRVAVGVDPLELDLGARRWMLQGVRPALQGEFQAVNAACAMGALEALADAGFPLDERCVREGLEEAWLPGRLQVLRRRPLVIADGAHNPAAAEELARYLEPRLQGRPLALVAGMMSSHEPEEVLSRLAPLARWVIATETGEAGTRPCREIVQSAERYCTEVSACPEVNEAISWACALAGRDGVVCVTGSFYLLGHIRRPLRVTTGAA